MSKVVNSKYSQRIRRLVWVGGGYHLCVMGGRYHLCVIITCQNGSFLNNCFRTDKKERKVLNFVNTAIRRKTMRTLPFKYVPRVELSLLALASSPEFMQNLWLSARGTQGHKYLFKAEVDKSYKKTKQSQEIE